MIRFLELLIALALVAVFYVVLGVFLPDKRNVDHAMETNHPVRQVFDTLNSFKRFGDWHPLRMHDPRIGYTLSGPDKGVGAKLTYQSRDKRIGQGSWEIIESLQDQSIVYRIDDPAYGFNKIARMDLTEKGKTVEIKWSYGVEYGWDLRGRYAGLYVVRNVGDDIKAGLANLVGLIATMPNFDYKTLEVVESTLAPQHMIYVSTTSDRNITAVENAMLAALGDVRKAVADNGLETLGVPRLITTSFGSDKYEFDVAVPVGRAGTTSALETQPTDAPADAATDAATDAPAVDVAATDVPPPVALEPLEGLRLPENVLQGQTYGGRALQAVYQGHPAALPLVRDMLRSYAAAHGLTIHDRAFEEYLTEIDQTSAEDAQFNVYWPIR